MLVFILISTAKATDFRNFKSTDGRAVYARILDYDEDKKKVLIERQGGKSTWVIISVFCQEDREFIDHWIKAGSANIQAAGMEDGVEKANETKREIPDAIAELEESAQKGSGKSYYLIGEMYRQGRGVPKDLPLALTYFEKAFDAGYDYSANMIGKMLMAGGDGVEQKEKRALERWYVGADLVELHCIRSLARYYGGNQTASKRNGKKAGAFADLIKDEEPFHLYAGVVAMAYAEAGRFDDAVYHQERLIQFINERYPGDQHANYRNGFRINLEFYKNGKAIPARN